VSFKKTVPIESRHADFNKDSISCIIVLDAKKKNIVIPFFIFVSDKKKYRICYQLYGKGISAREYTCRYTNLVIKNDSVIVGKSKDPDLFSDVYKKVYPKYAISPFYNSQYLMELKDPKKMRLTMELEFEITNTRGVTEKFLLRTPLTMIHEKKTSLFNIFK